MMILGRCFNALNCSKLSSSIFKEHLHQTIEVLELSLMLTQKKVLIFFRLKNK
jgi:hypothetical protein